MKIIMQNIILILLCSSFFILTSCTSPGKNMIPKGGDMTMSQIYQNETSENNSGSLQGIAKIRQALLQPQDTVSDTQLSYNENNNIDTEFKRMPNPEIRLYLYPHLVHENGESYPKPAMTTAFFLYKRNHFAMPNEIY